MILHIILGGLIMNISIGVIIGIIITFAIMGGVGVYAGRKIKNSEDFVVAGRKASPVMIAGTIVGSCVGAGGTVGTAQTAFSLGLVGWWQTLGLGLGVLLLSLIFSQAVYKTHVETAPQLLEKTYGSQIRPITGVFSSIAIFFSLLSQVKGFIPLMQSLIEIPTVTTAIIGVALILLFVVFGGIFATSLGGVVKIVLTMLALLLGAIIAVVGMGGFSGIKEFFPYDPYLNIFARGASKDLAIGLGFILGVLVTQTYIQAVLSAKDPKAARNGTMLASALTIPIGLLGVAIGMYMKMHFPEMEAARALPQFLLIKFPSVIAGIFIGTLMLASLGSASGLSLGIATMLSRDVFQRIIPRTTEKQKIFFLRTSLIIVVVLSGFFAVSKAGELIQTFIFLSFGMRTTVFLIPMTYALFYKGKLTKAAGMASVIAGPVANIYWNLAKPNDVDPIYIGLAAGLIAFIVANEIAKRVKKDNPITEVEAQKN